MADDSALLNILEKLSKEDDKTNLNNTFSSLNATQRSNLFRIASKYAKKKRTACFRNVEYLFVDLLRNDMDQDFSLNQKTATVPCSPQLLSDYNRNMQTVLTEEEAKSLQLFWKAVAGRLMTLNKTSPSDSLRRIADVLFFDCSPQDTNWFWNTHLETLSYDLHETELPLLSCPYLWYLSQGVLFQTQLSSTTTMKVMERIMSWCEYNQPLRLWQVRQQTGEWLASVLGEDPSQNPRSGNGVADDDDNEKLTEWTLEGLSRFLNEEWHDQPRGALLFSRWETKAKEIERVSSLFEKVKEVWKSPLPSQGSTTRLFQGERQSLEQLRSKTLRDLREEFVRLPKLHEALRCTEENASTMIQPLIEKDSVFVQVLLLSSPPAAAASAASDDTIDARCDRLRRGSFDWSAPLVQHRLAQEYHNVHELEWAKKDLVPALKTVLIKRFFEQCRRLVRKQTTDSASVDSSSFETYQQKLNELVPLDSLVEEMAKGQLRGIDLSKTPTQHFLSLDTEIEDLLISWKWLEEHVRKLQACESLDDVLTFLQDNVMPHHEKFKEHWKKCEEQAQMLAELSGEQSADLEVRLKCRVERGNVFLRLRFVDGLSTKPEKLMVQKLPNSGRQKLPDRIIESESNTQALLESVRTSRAVSSTTSTSTDTNNNNHHKKKYTEQFFQAGELLVEKVLKKMLEARFPLATDAWIEYVPICDAKKAATLLKLKIDQLEDRLKEWLEVCFEKASKTEFLQSKTLRELSQLATAASCLDDVVKNAPTLLLDGVPLLPVASTPRVNPIGGGSGGMRLVQLSQKRPDVSGTADSFLELLVTLSNRHAHQGGGFASRRWSIVSEYTTKHDLEWELERVTKTPCSTVFLVVENAYPTGTVRMLLEMLQQRWAQSRRLLMERLTIAAVADSKESKSMWKNHTLFPSPDAAPQLPATLMNREGFLHRGTRELVCSDGPATGKSAYAQQPRDGDKVVTIPLVEGFGEITPSLAEEARDATRLHIDVSSRMLTPPLRADQRKGLSSQAHTSGPIELGVFVFQLVSSCRATLANGTTLIIKPDCHIVMEVHGEECVGNESEEQQRHGAAWLDMVLGVSARTCLRKATVLQRFDVNHISGRQGDLVKKCLLLLEVLLRDPLPPLPQDSRVPKEQWLNSICAEIIKKDLWMTMEVPAADVIMTQLLTKLDIDPVALQQLKEHFLLWQKFLLTLGPLLEKVLYPSVTNVSSFYKVDEAPTKLMHLFRDCVLQAAFLTRPRRVNNNNNNNNNNGDVAELSLANMRAFGIRRLYIPSACEVICWTGELFANVEEWQAALMRECSGDEARIRAETIFLQWISRHTWRKKGIQVNASIFPHLCNDVTTKEGYAQNLFTRIIFGEFMTTDHDSLRQFAVSPTILLKALWTVATLQAGVASAVAGPPASGKSYLLKQGAVLLQKKLEGEIRKKWEEEVQSVVVRAIEGDVTEPYQTEFTRLKDDLSRDPQNLLNFDRLIADLHDNVNNDVVSFFNERVISRLRDSFPLLEISTFEQLTEDAKGVANHSLRRLINQRSPPDQPTPDQPTIPCIWSIRNTVMHKLLYADCFGVNELPSGPDYDELTEFVNLARKQSEAILVTTRKNVAQKAEDLFSNRLCILDESNTTMHDAYVDRLVSLCTTPDYRGTSFVLLHNPRTQDGHPNTVVRESGRATKALTVYLAPLPADEALMYHRQLWERVVGVTPVWLQHTFDLADLQSAETHLEAMMTLLADISDFCLRTALQMSQRDVIHCGLALQSCVRLAQAMKMSALPSPNNNNNNNNNNDRQQPHRGVALLHEVLGTAIKFVFVDRIKSEEVWACINNSWNGTNADGGVVSLKEAASSFASWIISEENFELLPGEVLSPVPYLLGFLIGFAAAPAICFNIVSPPCTGKTTSFRIFLNNARGSESVKRFFTFLPAAECKMLQGRPDMPASLIAETCDRCARRQEALGAVTFEGSPANWGKSTRVVLGYDEATQASSPQANKALHKPYDDRMIWIVGLSNETQDYPNVSRTVNLLAKHDPTLISLQCTAANLPANLTDKIRSLLTHSNGCNLQARDINFFIRKLSESHKRSTLPLEIALNFGREWSVEPIAQVLGVERKDLTLKDVLGVNRDLYRPDGTTHRVTARARFPCLVDSAHCFFRFYFALYKLLRVEDDKRLVCPVWCNDRVLQTVVTSSFPYDAPNQHPASVRSLQRCFHSDAPSIVHPGWEVAVTSFYEPLARDLQTHGEKQIFATVSIGISSARFAVNPNAKLLFLATKETLKKLPLQTSSRLEVHFVERFSHSKRIDEATGRLQDWWGRMDAKSRELCPYITEGTLQSVVLDWDFNLRDGLGLVDQAAWIRLCAELALLLPLKQCSSWTRLLRREKTNDFVTEVQKDYFRNFPISIQEVAASASGKPWLCRVTGNETPTKKEEGEMWLDVAAYHRRDDCATAIRKAASHSAIQTIVLYGVDSFSPARVHDVMRLVEEVLLDKSFGSKASIGLLLTAASTFPLVLLPHWHVCVLPGKEYDHEGGAHAELALALLRQSDPDSEQATRKLYLAALCNDDIGLKELLDLDGYHLKEMLPMPKQEKVYELWDECIAEGSTSFSEALFKQLIKPAQNLLSRAVANGGLASFQAAVDDRHRTLVVRMWRSLDADTSGLPPPTAAAAPPPQPPLEYHCKCNPWLLQWILRQQHQEQQDRATAAESSSSPTQIVWTKLKGTADRDGWWDLLRDGTFDMPMLKDFAKDVVRLRRKGEQEDDLIYKALELDVFDDDDSICEYSIPEYRLAVALCFLP